MSIARHEWLPVVHRRPATTLRRDISRSSWRPCPYQRPLDATRPGDTTPGSCERLGTSVMPDLAEGALWMGVCVLVLFVSGWRAGGMGCR
jgi:hypothetical protein